MASLLTGCDKLSDDDDAVAELLPGTWTFSYELQSEEETGLSFNYDHVIFRTDSTVTITYPGGQLDGKYRAGSAEIRIEGKLADGQDRLMHWVIQTFSNKQIKAEYKFEYIYYYLFSNNSDYCCLPVGFCEHFAQGEARGKCKARHQEADSQLA